MRSIYIAFIILIIIVLSGVKVSCGEVYYLTLEKALALAKQHNPDLLRSRMDFLAAEANYKSTRAELFPSMKLELSAPNYNESLSEQYIYNPVTQSYGWKWMPTGDYRYQGRIFLEQKLPTGGEINISSMLYQRDYYIGSSSDSLQTEYSSVIEFMVQQPILQPNALKISQRQSYLNFQKARLSHEIRRRDLDYIIAVAYYSLVRADRQLKLEEEDYKRWQNSVKTAQEKFTAGLIPEVEVWKFKVELARRQGSLSAAYSNYLNTADDFKIILGINLVDSLSLEAEIDKIPIEEGDKTEAMSNWQEIISSEIDVELSRLNFEDIKSSQGINAYLQAYYIFDAKEPQVDALTDNFEQDRGISLTLTIPLLDWQAAKRKIEAARINLEKTKFNLEQRRKDFIATLNKADRSMEAAQSRLKSSKLAEELARKSYEITLARFKTGAVTSNDLIDAQISLNQAKHELLDSIIDYNIAAVKYKTVFVPQLISGVSQ